MSKKRYDEYTRTKSALLDRWTEALLDLYHNATPNHPILDDAETAEYWNWFEFIASSEIEYIQGGLGISAKEWAHQAKLGFQHNERYFWLVSRITEFGKLYQWGRGGRTLAPDDLICQGGGSSFRIRDGYEWDEYSNGTLTDYIQIVEAFNHYVGEWCKRSNLQAMWDEEKHSIEYFCRECGALIEATNNEVAYCPSHPTAIVDSCPTTLSQSTEG